MTTPVAQALLSVTDTGRHGSARLGAVSALAEALGCQVRSRDPLTGHRHRSPSGDYYLTIYGPAATVTWLQATLPAIVARLDEAASAATRGYASWLRDGCPANDHMPAERAGLRARWRREYLLAYGRILAARIRMTASPATGPYEPAHLYRGHQARLAAERDAGNARLADYSPPPGRHQVDGHLLVAVAAAARAGGGQPALPMAATGRIDRTAP
jgi:hypothetical protein